MSLIVNDEKEIFEKTIKFIDKIAKLADLLIEHIDSLTPIVDSILCNTNDEKSKKIAENATNELKMLAEDLTKAKNSINALQIDENTDLQVLMTYSLSFQKKITKISLFLQNVSDIFQKYLNQ